MTTLMTVGTDLPQVRKHAVSFLFSPRISHEKRCFTKTGSGQTDENHSKRAFCLTQHTVIATALSATTLINTSVRIRFETALSFPFSFRMFVPSLSWQSDRFHITHLASTLFLAGHCHALPDGPRPRAGGPALIRSLSRDCRWRILPRPAD
jgi:hypothetical protein